MCGGGGRGGGEQVGGGWIERGSGHGMGGGGVHREKEVAYMEEGVWRGAGMHGRWGGGGGGRGGGSRGGRVGGGGGGKRRGNLLLIGNRQIVTHFTSLHARFSKPCLQRNQLLCTDLCEFPCLCSLFLFYFFIVCVLLGSFISCTSLSPPYPTISSSSSSSSS